MRIFSVRKKKYSPEALLEDRAKGSPIGLLLPTF